MTASILVSEKHTPGLRWFIGAMVILFVSLAAAVTFTRSHGAEAEAARYFPKQLIDENLRYAFQRRLLFWAGTFVDLAFLVVLVATPLARRLTDQCARACRGWWLPTVLLVGAFCFLGEQMLSLPFRLARLELAWQWGMTERTLASWLEDYAKSLLLSAGMGAALLIGFYGLLRLLPRYWWIAATVGSLLFGVLYAMALPIFINPLFNSFTPLDDPHLLRRIEHLTRQAGVTISDVTVMDASRQGRHTNAYFTGFGATKRIVLYDTLVKSSTTPDPATAAGIVAAAGTSSLIGTAMVCDARAKGLDEVETILAHEMGHWLHDHIVKGIALAGVGVLLALFLLSRFLRWAVQRRPFLLQAPHDPAGLPLVLLLMALGQWLSMPVENAVSRHFERQADAMSLELARQPEAFIAAEIRLARDNRANVAPTPFVTALFSTHPPTVERIHMAEAWREQHGKASP